MAATPPAGPPVTFPPQFEGLGVPSHPAALAWLERYFAERHGAWPSDWNKTEIAPPPPPAPGCPGSSAVGSEPPGRRRFLVLSPVGGGWTPDG